MKSTKKLLTVLLSTVGLMLVLAACSSDPENEKKEKIEKVDEIVKEETVKTFLLYEETSTSDAVGSVGDLYIKTFDTESEKIASNVLNGHYEYNVDKDTVLFVTEDLDFYEYKKGADKTKIATNVDDFTGLLSNEYIFYQNEEDDLYIIDRSRETEKIASSVKDFDLIDSNLYYLGYDGDLNVYNVQSRQESAIGTDISDFKLLNTDGDLTYLNDDSMLFYKKNGEEPIRISSKEVNPSFISQLDDNFVYIAKEDEDQVLYQTSIDGGEPLKIATDVLSYTIHKDNIVYLTFDENLFMKKPEDESAFKLASDVAYFSVSDDIVLYMDIDRKVFSTTLEGEKSEKAPYADSLRIAQDNSIIYKNDKEELFINNKKIATGVDAYALFNNNVAYATKDNKLHFVENLGESIVIEENLSKFSVVTYQNEVVFSNYLTFDDISGDWKISENGQTGYVSINKDGTMSNRLFGTTFVFELIKSGTNFMDVMVEGDYGIFRLEGNSLTLKFEYSSLTLERVSKQEMGKALDANTKLVDQSTVSNGLVTEQIADATLDTVPYPSSINTVESARDQIKYLIQAYLDTYVNLDTSYLEVYIHDEASLYKDQLNYMNSLVERGVELYLDRLTILDMKLLSPTKFSVTTSESYTIDNPEKGVSEVTQTTKYTVEIINHEFYITALKI